MQKAVVIRDTKTNPVTWDECFTLFKWNIINSTEYCMSTKVSTSPFDKKTCSILLLILQQKTDTIVEVSCQI
jgi:hypothetical protein